MEVTTAHRTMAVSEPSQPSAARFLAHELADSAGFNESDRHRAGLVATELATNMVKHAKGGEFLARVVAGPPAGEIELIALDRGPGIADLANAMRDGHSTAGSPGTGFGSIRRQADTIDMFSDARGTVVFVRLSAGRRGSPGAPASALLVSAVSVPKQGEAVCGDGWNVRHDVSGLTSVMADGLGHGLHAHEASVAALQAFRARNYSSNADALRWMHDGIRHTRGAAAAVARIARDQRMVVYAGVGNISTAILHSGSVRQAVSHNGTLGHEARVIREYTYPWQPGSLLVMHSDGLQTHWSLDEYRGLRQRHPAVIAAVMYRDFNRGRDDVTVLVAQEAA